MLSNERTNSLTN